MLSEATPRVMAQTLDPSREGMAQIAGSAFRMGSDMHHAEERLAHSVSVDGVWIDWHTVSNADFTAFGAATGYVTFAERPLDAARYPGHGSPGIPGPIRAATMEWRGSEVPRANRPPRMSSYRRLDDHQHVRRPFRFNGKLDKLIFSGLCGQTRPTKWRGKKQPRWPTTKHEQPSVGRSAPPRAAPFSIHKCRGRHDHQTTTG
jgi:formylglycine-generating enzyme required for sulfatase activity